MRKLVLFLCLLCSLPAMAVLTITNTGVSSATSNTVTIVWTTSGNGTSQVIYGLNGQTNLQTVLDGTMGTAHSVSIAGLAPSQVYTYKVRSQDTGGTVYTGTAKTFSLCSAPGLGFTQVAGIINTSYEYGLYILTWADDSGLGGTPKICGATVTTPVTGTLDFHGNFSAPVPATDMMVPSPGHWNLAVTSMTGTGGAIGAFNINVSTTGDNQDISGVLQAAAAGQLQHVYYDPATLAFNPPISGTGTVTSVGLSTDAAWFTVGSSPIISGGTITINKTSGLTANEFLATPNGSTGVVGLRAIVGADLPAINLAASGAGGVTGNLGVANLDSGSGASSSTCWKGDAHWGSCGVGAGTVTSVGLALPATLFTVTNSPVTGAGTLTGTFASIAAHTFLGNNTAGAAVAAIVQPGFSDLSGSATTAQLPFTYGGLTTKLATIGAAWTGSAGAGVCIDADMNLVTSGCTSGTVTAFNGRTGAVSPTTGDYTLAQITATFSGPLSLASSTLSCPTCVTSAASLTANAVAIGSGSQGSQTISVDSTTTHALMATAGAPAFRALVAGDIPNLDAAKITTGVLTGAVGGTGNGFTAFTGPASSLKTFTLPNASAVILTDNALVTGAQGGTANGFFAVSGPASTLKTFTFPNASATVLTSNAAVTVAQGGTGVGTFTIHGVLIGQTTGAIVASSAGTTGQCFISNGASADPTFQSCGGTVSGLTTGIIPKAASSTSLANSALDDGVTTAATLTYAGAGGIVAPLFSTNGTDAGEFDLIQGTRGTVTANSVGIVAPASVSTAYQIVLPGAAATGILHLANSANVVTATISAIDIASADVTGILSGANGGTANGFMAFSGPASSLKTFTLPNASATILTSNAAVTVPQGGTGQVTLTNHGVLVGAATSGITQLAAAAAGTVLAGGGASSDPAFTANPTLSTLLFGGSSSGTITVQPQAAAGTYNFNLPIVAGTSGQPLLSGGGGAAAMTFGTLGVAGGGTGAATFTVHGVLMGETTAAFGVSAAGTSGQAFLSGGASADGSYGALSLAGGSSVVTGTLPVGNGGWGVATLTLHALYVGNATSAPTALAVGATNTLLHGNTGADPSYSAVVDADFSSTLGVAHGGTALATLTAHALYAGNGASAPTALAVGATGTVLIGNTGADPSYSAAPSFGTSVTAPLYLTTTRCAAAGSAANPSAVACSAAPSGSFSCATNASTGTCVVSTTAVTANSAIFIQPDSSLGTLLSVTCNTTADTGLTAPRISARTAATSFTIKLGTFTTNPLCYSYVIVN